MKQVCVVPLSAWLLSDNLCMICHCGIRIVYTFSCIHASMPWRVTQRYVRVCVRVEGDTHTRHTACKEGGGSGLRTVRLLLEKELAFLLFFVAPPHRGGSFSITPCTYGAGLNVRPKSWLPFPTHFTSIRKKMLAVPPRSTCTHQRVNNKIETYECK